MASDARMTDEMVNKSLNDITDNYRGFYYTAEEISLISDVPLHRLASLLEANNLLRAAAACAVVSGAARARGSCAARVVVVMLLLVLQLPALLEPEIHALLVSWS
jgi:hypothetical protein